MKYRPEIDGMRAVAVVAVILFHAGLHPFGGGFIGVDVFFVLSGYLITSIIVTELNAGSFKYRRFFERRVRRILPALIFVCLVCVPFAYLWMLPDELQNFGQSLVATGFSANNLLLYRTSDYWALASHFKPLLHTWSLGVEEQYYVLVPFFLALGWRISRRSLPVVIAVIGAASLGLAAIMVERSPTFAFYMLPTRAWELAAGALVSLLLIRRPGLPQHPRGPLLAALGLGLVLAPVFVFGLETDTPGLPLLIPVVGTCLLICFATEERGPGRILASRPFVAVGLVSYSAYLWHQPLFAFARIYAKETPSMWVFLTLALCTFPLAWATWRWVETPFRSRTRTSRRSVFTSAGAGVATMAAIGLVMHVTDGLPSRLPPSANAANSTIAYNEAVFDLKTDAFADDGRRRVLVVGNSFARDFINSVQETFPSDRLKAVDIVYRDDFPWCITDATGTLRALYEHADAVIFASGAADCAAENADVAAADGKDYVLVGTKFFGANLNWLMRSDDWTDRTNELPASFLEEEAAVKAAVPARDYVSWLEPVLIDGDLIPITDSEGRVLTTDRRHFSQAGAVYFGKRVLPKSPVEDALFGGGD